MCNGKCDTHNRLHVLQSDRLLQHHLVEGPNEESFGGNKQKCQDLKKKITKFDIPSAL